MCEQEYRIERDSLGEVRVPKDALYAAQTQRAVENFPISPLRFPRQFIRAMGLIKGAAAAVNLDLEQMDAEMAVAIQSASAEVADGAHDAHFPLDIFQTGSGTSSNMNANEVIATLASRKLGRGVHPNDHVNMGQSSNDVVPSAIHVSASLSVVEDLLPALGHLQETLDAMPIRLSQELGGWSNQIDKGQRRLRDALARLAELAQGGTAVGTGINAHPEFGARMAAKLTEMTGHPFRTSENYFESLSSQDAAVELSGQLKTIATSVMKIANDLRWMNSGPIAGIGEIALPALQPGSSIMPGKINPVIPEAVAMVAAQVTGNDLTITIGGQSGSFQLNVMLPVIACNLLQSVSILAGASRLLADRAIAGFAVNTERIAGLVNRNPILITALNPVIGYELGAQIAKTAYAQGRTLKEVALEMTDLSADELDDLLDPRKMTEGGIQRL